MVAESPDARKATAPSGPGGVDDDPVREDDDLPLGARLRVVGQTRMNIPPVADQGSPLTRTGDPPHLIGSSRAGGRGRCDSAIERGMRVARLGAGGQRNDHWRSLCICEFGKLQVHRVAPAQVRDRNPKRGTHNAGHHESSGLQGCAGYPP